MLLKRLAISTAIVLVATAALAQSSQTVRTNDMFRGPRLTQSITTKTEHSKDAILPDGTINVDPTVTGSVTSQSGDTSFSEPRLQCDSSPNTSEMRSNTFDMPLSGCP